MNAFIINAAPGVGKTSLLHNFPGKGFHNLAVLDGDDVGRIIPHQPSSKWLDLVHDNMVACVKNYLAYGIDTVVVVFAFVAKERFDKFENVLRSENIQTRRIILFCDDKEIERRNMLRDASNGAVLAKIGINCNMIIKSFEADYRIDTTKMSINDVVGEIYRIVTAAS